MNNEMRHQETAARAIASITTQFRSQVDRDGLPGLYARMSLALQPAALRAIAAEGARGDHSRIDCDTVLIAVFADIIIAEAMSQAAPGAAAEFAARLCEHMTALVAERLADPANTIETVSFTVPSAS